MTYKDRNRKNFEKRHNFVLVFAYKNSSNSIIFFQTDSPTA